MKRVRGIFLPNSDRHFETHFERNNRFMGRGAYQLEKFEAIKPFLQERSCGLALDVGAHVGLWTMMLRTVYRNVIAFEPVPHLIECWKANCDHLSGVILQPYAVGHTSAHINFNYIADNTGNSHVAVGEYLGSTNKARMITLDCILPCVDFIKIDVEGYESRVIVGAGQLIQRDRPLILIEQKPGHAERYGDDRFAAKRALEELGYMELWSKSGDYLMGTKCDNRSG